jgi:pimeloyl-ACP methyl ester carboxylesterase
MAFATIDGVRIYYRLEGNPSRPLVVMAHALGADHGQWEPQISALLPHFQVLRYDVRGHGASDAPAGDYTIEQLGRDVLGVTDAAGGREFAFCGLSMGRHDRPVAWSQRRQPADASRTGQYIA